MAKPFDKPLMVMVLSIMPGKLPILACFPTKLMNSYISSEIINISGNLLNTSTKEANSVSLKTEPVGLHGEEKIKAFDLGVMAASNCEAVILKSFSMVPFIRCRY
jgi:hypothetical protein